MGGSCQSNVQMNARTKEIPAEGCIEKSWTGVKYLTIRIFVCCVSVWFSILGFCQHILVFYLYFFNCTGGNINHLSFGTRLSHSSECHASVLLGL